MAKAVLKVVAEDSSIVQPPSEAVQWTGDGIMKMSKEHRTFTNILVTPQLATLLLQFNTANRPQRQLRVNEFITVLREGRFINTGEPIIMSDAAILNEGQHRLKAVAESGIPAIMDVRFGVARDAFVVTGTGATRTPGDMLALAGFTNVYALAATAKMAQLYREGLPGSWRWRIGNDAVLDAVKRWPDIFDAVTIARRVLKSPLVYNAAANCFTFLALRQPGSSARVEEFLEIVQTGLADSTRNPARLLREKLTQDRELRHSRSEMTVDKLALFILAWNGWKTNDRPARLAWRRTDPFPKMAGVKL